jgi:dihydrodipicolinate synthase/N-acetylneuraminate lyase
VKHLETVARSVRIALVLNGLPSQGVLRRLQSIDSLVAIKEEFTTDYTIPIYREFGDRWNIFAGGTKAWFLTYRPYGMQAYYSAFATFAPEIAMLFWRAVEKDNLAQARQITLHYDVPFFERWNHAFWRATLECFGVASRYQRPPAETYSDQQMIQVKAFYQSLGLL